MNIQRISAVTLAVQDMARSVAFYQAIGLDILYGGAQASFTSFRLGDAFVNLILTPTYVGHWWGRLIFRVEKVDDLHAAFICQGDRCGITTKRLVGRTLFPHQRPRRA